MFRAIGDGFRYVRAHAVVQAVYPRGTSTPASAARALFPRSPHAVPRRTTDSRSALRRAGAGALVMAIRNRMDRAVRRQVDCRVGRDRLGASMTLFGLVHVVYVGLICLAVAGAMDVISTVLRNTILQNAITDEFRSRISSIQMAVVTEVRALVTSSPASSPTTPRRSSPSCPAASPASSA